MADPGRGAGLTSTCRRRAASLGPVDRDMRAPPPLGRPEAAGGGKSHVWQFSSGRNLAGFVVGGVGSPTQAAIQCVCAPRIAGGGGGGGRGGGERTACAALISICDCRRLARRSREAAAAMAALDGPASFFAERITGLVTAAAFSSAVLAASAARSSAALCAIHAGCDIAVPCQTPALSAAAAGGRGAISSSPRVAPRRARGRLGVSTTKPATVGARCTAACTTRTRKRESKDVQ